MTLHKIKLVVTLTLILCINGCRKDELTLPVRVHLEIGISPDYSLYNDFLSITECKIGIGNVRFEGQREAGGDIFFETDHRQVLPIIEFSKLPAIISTYDLPQGIYYYMKWGFSLRCVDGRLMDDLNETDSCEVISISGYYTSLNGSVIPFVFSSQIGWDGGGFGIKTFNPDGNVGIVLSVDKEYAAIILLAPGKAFNIISRKSFEEAEISGDIEHQIIIISSNQNEYLYEILTFWIFESASVIVKSLGSAAI